MLFFSRWPGTATAHTSKFVGIKLKKKTFQGRRCIPNLRFVRELKLILLRIGLFGDYEGRDFTIYLKYRAQLGVRFRLSGKHKKTATFSQKAKNDLLDVCWTGEKFSEATVSNVTSQISSLRDDTNQKCCTCLKLTGRYSSKSLDSSASYLP